MSQRDELLLIACVHVDLVRHASALCSRTDPSRVTAAGRDPDLVKVLPGIAPVIGGTEAEALTLAAEFEELSVPDYALAQLCRMLGIDLTGLPLDGHGLPRSASAYAASTLVSA
ncbi:hypothetical protein [Micromonospora sp. NPDC005174]|uniref:hypothetical protein n=1 Tax=Micromonospora sp. NPDC005174 TaxID=3157018 RepID=UPI0033AC3903